MNFSGNFDAKLSHSLPASVDGENFNFDSTPGVVLNHDAPSTVVVPDAHLLFSGDYKRIGNDLIISTSDQKFVVGNYFKGENHPSLATKDGATLSGHIVDALTGHVMYAQATAPAGAEVCGHVMKMTGSASVIRNGVAVELHIGDAIQKGDVIQTGSDSSIGLTLADGSAFGMTSNARMVINEMIYDPNGSSNSSLISLVQGTITFVAGQTAKNGNMRVDTPVATMGIRGTAVLVEISANDGPTKFSVLVEPDGHTGSYNLYDKTTGQLLGTVSQSGQVTFVTSTGLGLPATAMEQPKTLQDQQSEKALIQQVFQLYFPNYNPDDSKPNSTKTGPRTDIGVPDNTTTKYAFDPVTGRPTLTVATPVTNPETGKITIISTTFANTPPIFRVTDAADVQATPNDPLGPHSFRLGDHVKIIDPDIGIAVFYDQAVPYVTNTGLIIQTTGPESIATNTAYLLDPSLITLNRATGVVTYDPEAFRFLGEGETAVYKFKFTSASGPDSATQQLVFTVTGHNDAPVFAVNDTPLTVTETMGKTGQTASHDVPLQLSFTDEDYSDVASSFSVSSSVSTNVAGTHSTTPDLSKLPDSDTLKSYLKIGADGAGTNCVTRATLSDGGQITVKFSAPDNVFDFLSDGEQIQLVYTIVVTDAHGASDTQTITITVTGTNDVPVLEADHCPHVLKETTGAALDAGVSTLETSGTLKFTDVDLNDQHTTSSPTTVASVTWEKSNGDDSGGVPEATLLALATALTATLSTDSAHGGVGEIGWTFKLMDGLADFLAEGETLTVTYNVTVDDGHNHGTSTQPVIVVITGTNDGPQAVADTNQGVAIVEAGNNVDGSTLAGNAFASGNVITNDTDVDLTDTHCIVGAGAGDDTSPLSNGATTIHGTYGTLILNANGSWTYKLDNDNPQTNALAQNEHASDVFTYIVSDNHGATSTATLTIDITGTNDSPQTNVAPVATTDVNGGAAIVEAGVDAMGQIVWGVDHATGDVLANDHDVDTGDTMTVQGVAAGTATGPISDGVGATIVGTYGSVTIEPNGSWTYTLDNKNAATQSLAQREHAYDVFTYTIHDSAGATSSAMLTIDVTGTNDAPTITASAEDVSGSATEDGALQAAGHLKANDVDHDATQRWSVVGSNKGIYGCLSVDQTGHWTYTLSNGTGDVQSLAAGEQHDETFTVRVVDDHGAGAEQTVTVTVHGTNDAPVLTASKSGRHLHSINEDQTENGGQTVASFLGHTISDADHNAQTGIAITGAESSHGHWEFSIDNGANWGDFGSYNLSSALLLKDSDLIRFFPDGEHGGKDTFNYVAWDGTSGDHGTTADASVRGGETAFSIDSDTAKIKVTPVDDAPVINVDNLHIATENGETIISGLSITDADDHAGFKVTTSADHGTISPAHGTNVSLSHLNSVLQNGVTYTPDASTVGQIDLTVTDHHGLSDMVHFVFVQQDSAGANLSAEGTGTNVLIGGSGNDMLTGGAGNDQFVFGPSPGQDVITNFASGHDTIMLKDIGIQTNEPNWFESWASTAITQQGADTLIHLNGSNTLLLTNVNHASLSANDFIIPHAV